MWCAEDFPEGMRKKFAAAQTYSIYRGRLLVGGGDFGRWMEIHGLSPSSRLHGLIFARSFHVGEWKCEARENDRIGNIVVFVRGLKETSGSHKTAVFTCYSYALRQTRSDSPLSQASPTLQLRSAQILQHYPGSARWRLSCLSLLPSPSHVIYSSGAAAITKPSRKVGETVRSFRTVEGPRLLLRSLFFGIAAVRFNCWSKAFH